VFYLFRLVFFRVWSPPHKNTLPTKTHESERKAITRKTSEMRPIPHVVQE
jgi:hypothetical protein